MKFIAVSLWLSICTLATKCLPGQCAISGKLNDILQVPIPFSPVGLLNFSDSLVIKGVITDLDGNYCFEGLKKGDYRLKISVLGFSTFYSDKIVYDSVNPIVLPSILLNPAGVNLNEISVAAQRKTVEFKNGNITVNVEGTALAMGNTVYDLLLRLPGVSVSDDHISIQGKEGVKILIDNKLQQLSGQQLINVLKSMNASEIEKIEVLKKPPVKYDAAGTGGMISVKTKKLKVVGFSGNVYGSYSQGFYGNPGGGFSLNYKGRKANFFSAFSANKEWRHMENDSKSTVNYQSVETLLHQTHVEKEHNHYETYLIGADWFINPYNSIGVKANGAFGMGIQDRVANTSISDNSLGYRNLAYNSHKPNPWIYPEFNLNAEHLFDTLGTSLRFVSDYNPYWDIYDAQFNSRFLDNDFQQVAPADVFRTSNTLTFKTLSNTLDFEKQFKKSIKLEAGLKHTYQEMLSDYTLENEDSQTGDYSTNAIYTNVFLYKQNISAGYLNMMGEYRKLSYQVGVRGENTLIHTLSKTNGLSYDRQYFNLFPMVSIDYKKSDNHTFQISYNKRVNRPDYNSFNPFRIFRSLLASSKGNPFLKPEYSHSVDLTYSYKTWMNHTFSYSRIYNLMMGYNTLNDSDKVTVNTTGNLKYGDIYSYSLFIQRDLKTWWSVNLNATVYGIYAKGIINDLPYSISTLGFNPGIFSRITLPENYSIELNAFYLAPVLEGTNYMKARNMVNLAFKKSLMENKLSLSFALNDLFFGLATNSYTDYQNQHTSETYRFDTRRVNVSVNYNFGKLKVQQRELKDHSQSGKAAK